MSFIDIHSHILPFVDDGATSLEESIALLKQEKEQGITTVVCTPHFYPEYDDFDELKEKINKSFSVLSEAVKDLDLPKIVLGKEVHFFTGIHHCNILEDFRIGKSTYMLLELPFLRTLPKGIEKELIGLSENIGYTVILAHVERYADDAQFKKIINLIKRGTLLAQVNAESLLFDGLKKPIDKLFKENLISFVASDAHSTSMRPVNIAAAMKIIREKYPAAYSKILRDSALFLEEVV